jgi:hypothetical protein
LTMNNAFAVERTCVGVGSPVDAKREVRALTSGCSMSWPNECGWLILLARSLVESE